MLFFFLTILEYSGLLSFSVFPRCQSLYTHQAGRTQALQQEWQSSEKSQDFEEKAQYLMNTLYYLVECHFTSLSFINSSKFWILERPLKRSLFSTYTNIHFHSLSFSPSLFSFSRFRFLCKLLQSSCF